MRLIQNCLLLLFFILVSAIHAFGQEGNTKVKIRITNAKSEAIPFASISILSIPDSSVRLDQITDSNGVAEFQLRQPQLYLIRFSAVNYQPFEKTIHVKSLDPVFNFTVREEQKSMTAIVVKAVKPLMRQEDDKTIVDPEVLAAVSTNAYEILEKTPGIFVDQDGNIYLSSTTPATVYINGREQKMSAADIATMMKNLPPNAIASIEILRTPSAKYDASGSGGIVNVILRKGIRIGLTGSVTAGLNQGNYGNQFIGLNLNNNNGALTTYVNLQYGRRNSFDEIRTNRFFSADTSVLSQDAGTKYSTNSYYLGYGLGYQLSKKWEMNYDGRISYNQSDNRSQNFSQISKTNTGQIINTNQALVQNKGRNNNYNQGINLKYKIDSLGSEWTNDFSYTYAPNTTSQFFNGGDGQLENRLHYFSGQTNLVKKLGKKTTFETGLKTTRIGFQNTTDYWLNNGGIRIKNLQGSGAYRYHESINSVYLQASRNISGFILKAGTRMENTNMEGRQLAPDDTSFVIHRTDFFPYIYLSRSVMKIAGFELRAYLVYRRTISRPAYEYLNPSSRMIDPYLYETGNPSLRPQFTKNWEANISVDERPIVAIGINDTKDIFTQVIYPSDTNSRVSARTYDNLGSNKETYIRLLGAIPPGGKYFFVVGAQYNHNFYRGLYESKPLSFKKGSWTFFTYHLLKITPLTQFSLNGFVRFNGQQQFYELSAFGEMRMSISQQFLNKKLNLTLSVNDLFRTNQNEFTINQGSVHASGMRQGDTRRFGLNLRYNFGLKKKEENNFMNVESPEGK